MESYTRNLLRLAFKKITAHHASIQIVNVNISVFPYLLMSSIPCYKCIRVCLNIDPLSNICAV